jgi:hypothetical protein
MITKKDLQNRVNALEKYYDKKTEELIKHIKELESFICVYKEKFVRRRTWRDWNGYLRLEEIIDWKYVKRNKTKK